MLLFILYFIFGPAKNIEAELMNEILYIFIIPPILISITIGICLLLGLFIKRIPKIYKWWLSKPFITFLSLLIGLILLVLTLNPAFIETKTILVNDQETIQETPNNYLLIIGWFLTAFSSLHFYPKHFLSFIRQKYKRKTN